MKIGTFGDLHLTNRNPERRKDDFLQAALGKVRQAMEFFKSQGCKYVFQPGDFFDSPTVARKVEAAIIKLLMEYKEQGISVLTCFGQHDISGHSEATFPNSPLAVVSEACVIFLGTHFLGEHVRAYGSSFGQDIPVPFSTAEEDYNILIAHRMIGNRPLWPGQPLENPRLFLRSHPEYRLVIVGDYHYHFIDRLKDQLIINPGALMRKSITDIDLDLQPSAFVIDLETLEVEAKVLEVSPAKEIFDLSRKETTNNTDVLNRLIKSLKDSKEKSGIAWKIVLNNVIAEKKVSVGAQKQIDIAVEESTSNG